MKLLPSIFKNKEITKQPLQWPSCKQPKTLSFREGNDNMFKTVNSVFFDPLSLENVEETPESWFTNSSNSASFSTESHEEQHPGPGEESLEMILRGIRSSKRLFFEPGSDTSSLILNHHHQAEETKMISSTSSEVFPMKESIVLAMESEDPYLDFKSSMQEMVESHGLKDWESLEELLGWYLKMNGKMNHGYIVGAFVDLLLGLASSTSSSDHSSSSFLSASSSSFSTQSSSPLSPVDQTEIEVEERG